MVLARSYFRRELYIEASSSYRQYLELFPQGDYEAEALLGLARSLLRDARGPRYNPLPPYQAASVCEDFMARFPTSPELPQARDIYRRAREKLAEHYFRLGKWYVKMRETKSAAVYFEKVREEYPRSEWAERAAQLLDVLEGSGESSDEG